VAGFEPVTPILKATSGQSIPPPSTCFRQVVSRLNFNVKFGIRESRELDESILQLNDLDTVTGPGYKSNASKGARRLTSRH